MRRLVLLVVFLNALLVALLIPGGSGLPWLATEALILAALLLLLPVCRLQTGLAWLAGVLYSLTAAFVVLDTLIRASLGRPLNLYHDFSIAGASVELLLGNLGLPLTLAVVVLALVLWLLLAALVARLLLAMAALGRGPAGRCLATGLAAVAVIGLALPVRLVDTTAAAIGTTQADRLLQARQASQAFRRQLDGQQVEGEGAALESLSQIHVVLAFVESYGVSALFDERYRPVVGPALDTMAEAAEQRGLHMVSGRLGSPVQGGQSWLAHASVLSGLWVESQHHYDALVASEAPTLIDDFRDSGHRSVAVMPAITKVWPEGRALGYDRIYDAAAMEYQGPAFNWVTMPDQYTWSRTHDRILEPARQPVFAELALVSGHAPWVPVLPVLADWNQIGEGEVFRQWQGAGESPASLWQDPERVREHYARAMAYSLEVIAGFIGQRMGDDTLLIIMGDHQAAPLVTGDSASRDVPVHLVSADPDLVGRFLGGAGDDGLAGFRAGAWPFDDEPGPGMDRLRPFLHRHF